MHRKFIFTRYHVNLIFSTISGTNYVSIAIYYYSKFGFAVSMFFLKVYNVSLTFD